MADQSAGFGKIMIGAFLGAVAAAFAAWFIGILPFVWKWLVGFLASLWSLVIHRVPVPLALLALLAAPWLAWIIRLLRAIAKPAGKDEQDPLANLGELELRMLRLMAREDGVPVSLADAVDRLRTSRLLLERACENLVGLELVRPRRDMYGLMFALTGAGRDFVISRRFQLGNSDR